jgi:prepilin-type N-terminal cleavage/methylation domain-containing protein
MNEYRSNENGLTLIEVLAAIAIFSIVLLLITNVVINSFNFHEKNYDKLELGREANLIITELRSIHQTVEEYKLESNDSGHLQLEINKNIRFLGSEGYQYKILDSQDLTKEKKIDVKDNDTSVFFTLIVIHEKTNKSISLETTLSRFKEETNE